MKRKNTKLKIASINPTLPKRLAIIVITSSVSLFAFAAKDNDAAMKSMVQSAESLFAGSFLQIALNFGGLAAIGYSILGGFRPAPFIGGIGLLIFNALYFGYLKSYFG